MIQKTGSLAGNGGRLGGRSLEHLLCLLQFGETVNVSCKQITGSRERGHSQKASVYGEPTTPREIYVREEKEKKIQ